MEKKTTHLLIGGVLLLIASEVWSLVLPFNKNLWSSSFVLHAGGWSFILLSVFYYLIDVKGYRGWAFFFTVIGMNSILIYMSDKFIDWEFTASSLFQWLVQITGDSYKLVITAICVLVIKWAFLYFMYRKNVFLRV